MFPDRSAKELVQKLLSTGNRIVFAESCTAGLIAAALGRVPGVSDALCGSAVVYQVATKAAWLNVSPELLENPGPVSQEVSEQMARGVLTLTSHAKISASVTGHLGPDAPDELDGVVWSTVAVRRGTATTCESRQLDISAAEQSAENMSDGVALRKARQICAAEQVIRFCIEVLDRR